MKGLALHFLTYIASLSLVAHLRGGNYWTLFTPKFWKVLHAVLHSELFKYDFNSPSAVRDYLRLKMAEFECEVFSVIFLDAQHGVITTEEMFRGTLSQASVYPHEVVKRALYHNAAAVIFAHNHPSGVCEPSQADEILTDTLKKSLALVDVKALDHFIVAGTECMSFAERGLI